MQLILVAHGGCASFKIRHIAAIVTDNQRTLKLSHIDSIDAEVSGQLHRTAHTFWNIDKRTVAEDGGIQCRIEIVTVRHDGTEILAYQVRILLHRLGERAEQDTQFSEFLAESGTHRDGIHHGIDRNTTQRCTLLKRDAELVKSLLQLGVNLRLLLCLAARIGIIRYLLVIYLREADVAPRRLLQGFPIAESLQAQVKQPPGFFLARGNHAHNILVEPFLDNIIRGYRRRKTVSVLFFGNLFYETIVSRLITHHSNYFS